MPTINEIAVTYRQHLARLPKHNTRTDYSKRLAMLERWCSMHGIHPTQEGQEMMADLLVGFLKGLK
jgi:cytosine/adenosine deaminase-related metal-dependent hydrolase